MGDGGAVVNTVPQLCVELMCSLCIVVGAHWTWAMAVLGWLSSSAVAFASASW